MKLIGLLSAALLLGSAPAFAQQQGGQGGQTQSQGQQGQAQLPGTSNQQRWSQERAAGPGAVVHIGPAGVRIVQQRLNAIGYSAGNLSGTWDDTTSRAAAAFQAAADLEPTGTLTVPLLNALGLHQIMLGHNIPRPSPGTGGAQQQRWQQETSSGQATPLMASPAQVRLVQQRLNQLGYNAGPLTGQWNNETQAATAAFQAANNLEPTGSFTVAFINMLGIAQPFWTNGIEVAQRGGGSVQGQRWAQETSAGAGVPIWISPASVRLVQQALNRAGYDVGNLTGDWNQQTQQSALRFKAAWNLEPVPQLTTNLLTAVGMPQWAFGQVLSFRPSQAVAGMGGQGQGQRQGQGGFGAAGGSPFASGGPGTLQLQMQGGQPGFGPQQARPGVGGQQQGFDQQGGFAGQPAQAGAR